MRRRDVAGYGWAVVFGALALGVASAAPADRAVRAGAKAGPEWTLIFHDDFERQELGDQWTVLSGKWEIEGGRLFVSPWETGGSREILLARDVTGCQRIEVDVEVPEDYEAADIAPMIHVGPTGYASGYLLQFGGASNTMNLLRRLGVGLDEEDRPLIQPGRTHRLVAELDGHQVRLLVDGKPVLAYSDDEPLLGEGHTQCGFYVTFAGYLDNVRVYAKPAATAPAGENTATKD